MYKDAYIMKIVFVSNYYTHHQSEFSQMLYAMKGIEYKFIATEEMKEERKNLGWNIQLPTFVYDYEFYTNNGCLCKQWIDEADIVVIGSAPLSLIENRRKSNQLTFMYSERIYKKRVKWYKIPIHYIRFRKQGLQNRNIYMLCASAFTSADYAKTHTFINRCYKWGYFPKTYQYDSIENLIQRKKPTTVLWVARFIDWKHPEHVIAVARRLKAENFDFQIQMVGIGPLWDTIAQQIIEYGLQDQVQLVGAVPADQVRKYMDDASIFLFTSDRNEGWGAVLNEAMNSGCAVVASNAIGAVPFLIKDGENGLCYKSCDVDDLYNKVKYLLEHAEYRNTIGRKAYETIITLWNAETAAQRLVSLSEKFLQNEKSVDLYEEGPCSRV